MHVNQIVKQKPAHPAAFPLRLKFPGHLAKHARLTIYAGTARFFLREGVA